jgi:hypothetical protein
VNDDRAASEADVADRMLWNLLIDKLCDQTSGQHDLGAAPSGQCAREAEMLHSYVPLERVKRSDSKFSFDFSRIYQSLKCFAHFFVGRFVGRFISRSFPVGTRQRTHLHIEC